MGKVWTLRVLSLLGFLVGGWVLHFILAPLGYAWVVWLAAGALSLWVLLEIGLRLRTRRNERVNRERWRRAITEPELRKDSIKELRRALESARRLGPRLRVRQARLSVALAEIHLAEGKPREAARVLAKVPDDLEPMQAAVIRLARAEAYLYEGSEDEAALVIKPLDARLGDAVLEASRALIRGHVALSEGDAERSLAEARRVAELCERHDELWDDARGLEALALHTLERPEDAAAALGELSDEGRAQLLATGPARVRALIEA